MNSWSHNTVLLLEEEGIAPAKPLKPTVDTLTKIFILVLYKTKMFMKYCKYLFELLILVSK